MKEALGLIEIRGLTTAILVADTMAKTSNIKILNIENTKGLGYMTIKVCGDVGAVNSAVMSGTQIAIENGSFVSSKVIPRCSKEVDIIFCKSKQTTKVKNNPDNKIIDKSVEIDNNKPQEKKIRKNSKKTESKNK